jgi:hypothetical protein
MNALYSIGYFDSEFIIPFQAILLACLTPTAIQHCVDGADGESAE